jgi:hypothetical protein
MHDDLALTLPVCEINRRLTVIAREQHRLRALLRIAIEARDDAEKFGLATPPAPRPEARPEGVAHA